MQKIKERPIVLNAKEVNAVLLDKKTQHRIPALTNEQIGAGYKVCYGVASGQVVFTKDENDDSFGNGDYLTVNCPFGSVSDRLWVQEDWRVGAWRESGILAIDYKASPEITNTPWVSISDDEDGKKFNAMWTAVTDELDGKGVEADEDHHYRWPAGQAPLDWRNSSTMEQWASRILLEITNIRIECVQDIKLGDALKEGCTGLMDFAADYWMPKHGEAAWFKDPWVWVIEFKKVEG